MGTYSGNNAWSLGNILDLNRVNNLYKDFDAKNISSKQLGSLRTDVYGGYKEARSNSFHRPSTGVHKPSKGTGQTDYDYYKLHKGWSGIGDHLGISKINSDNDVRKMYDFVNGYKPAAAASQKSSGPAAPQQATNTSFQKQLASIQNKYKAENKRLSDSLKVQQDAYKEQSDTFNKKFTDMGNTIANQANIYAADNNSGSVEQSGFNPAMSIAEKGRRVSKGTSQFNRKLKINNLNI